MSILDKAVCVLPTVKRTSDMCTGDFASNMTALAREAKKQIMQENVRGVGEDGTLTPAPGASRRF